MQELVLPHLDSSLFLAADLLSIELHRFWNHTLQIAENHEDDFKHQALPLARIKKVAKMDPDVQVRLESLSLSPQL